MSEKSEKKKPKVIRLDPTAEEVKRAEEMLRSFLENHPEKLKENETIEDKVQQIIQKAIEGYPYAPKTFLGRIRSISRINLGYDDRLGGTDINSYIHKREEEIQKILAEREKDLYPGLSMQDLRKSLSPAERKRWIEREAYYRNEFDLNNASDVPLLLQVLTEEIIQYRLIKQKLKDQNADVDKQLTESYNRLNKALEHLGITRRQRQSVKQESEGNIAKLAEILDEKLRRIDAIMEKDLREEETLGKLRSSPEVFRYLPQELHDIVQKAMDSPYW